MSMSKTPPSPQQRRRDNRSPGYSGSKVSVPARGAQAGGGKKACRGVGVMGHVAVKERARGAQGQ